MIAQSGGLCVALNRLLAERSLMPSYMVSAGNQLGLAAGDYIRFEAGTQHAVTTRGGCTLFVTASLCDSGVSQP